MRFSSRAKKSLLVFALLLSIGVAVTKSMPHGLVRCYLVRWSDLDHIAPNLYVDSSMSAPQKQALLSRLAEAQQRIATLYGGYTANPTIIAGDTMEVMKAYGDNSYNRAGRTYLTLAATFIILGPDGTFSVDVLSHELAHAEFSSRIGYRNRDEIPNWFDEGLAVQLDDRYSEAAWQSRTDNGRAAPDLDQIGIIRYDDWLGYATAKQEVGRWLDVVGQEGFWLFLQAIQSGDEFQETFNSIEKAYAGTD